MKNKYFLTIALAFASIGLFAQQTNWTATGDAADWDVAANWDNGVPEAGTKVVFNNPAGADCNINDATAVAGQLVMGDGDDNAYGGRITVKDGAVFSPKLVTEWSAVGYNNGGEMLIEAGGLVESDHRFHVGLVDPRRQNGDPVAILEVAGTLKVNGDMMDNKNFSINPDDHPGWVAETYITAGGVIDCPFFWMGEGLLDITGGLLIIRDNPDFYMPWKEATMGELLDEAIVKGWLTAEGGTEEPIVEMEITEGDTVIYVKSSTTVGVFDNKVAKKASIGVYPNPATDVVNFTENVDEVKIYSITGEIVLRRNNVSAVDIETLKPGYYIIKSEANRSTYIDKLLVK